MVSHTEWYRIFLYAAEASNLTKAALQLHMTQPSVSYAIKQLEETLGVTLFNRLPKGVRLTEEGKVLYRHVRLAFEELGAAELHMNNLRQLHEGIVRIGANGAIIRDSVLPALDAFHDRYPDIHIQLIQDQSSSIVDRLKKGELDLGFVHLPVSDDEIEIVASRISPYCVVAGRAFEEYSNQPLSAAQLTKLPLLLLSSGSSTRKYVERWFQAQGMEAKADFELSSLDMLAEFAERGYGATFLPRAFIASGISRRSLLELRTEVPLPDRQIGIAARRQTPLSIAAESFRELLQAQQ